MSDRDFFADLGGVLPNGSKGAAKPPSVFGEDDVLALSSVSPRTTSDSRAGAEPSAAGIMAGAPMVRPAAWRRDARDGCIPVLVACDRAGAGRGAPGSTRSPLSRPSSSQRKDSSKDLEGAVQQVFQKFTGGLQKILEVIDRCLAAPRRRRRTRSHRASVVLPISFPQPSPTIPPVRPWQAS